MPATGERKGLRYSFGKRDSPKPVPFQNPTEALKLDLGCCIHSSWPSVYKWILIYVT